MTEPFSFLPETPLALPCADKLAFDTVKAASATKTVAAWRHGAKLKVYHCRHCDLYHLSSNDGE